MSYSDTMNYLIQNQYFSIVVILDPNGGVYWTNQPEWTIDGKSVISAWQSKSPSIVIGRVQGNHGGRTRRGDPGYTFVDKNLGGGGTVIIHRAPNGYYFLTWSEAGCPFQPMNIHAEVSIMANQFG